MESSEAVNDAVLRFYDRLSAGDVASFDTIVADDPATLIVGTAPGEIITDRAALRFGFETEGVTLTGNAPSCWANGPVGFAVDEPMFGFPDGTTIKIRLTLVLQDEGDGWRIVHGHFSVGVPDEEVGELQKRWLS